MDVTNGVLVPVGVAADGDVNVEDDIARGADTETQFPSAEHHHKYLHGFQHFPVATRKKENRNRSFG